MKIIYVEDPNKCPWNLDNRCANEDTDTAHSCSNCGDSPHEKEFPGWCPLNEPDYNDW